ncbi:hypothetical protein [Nocardia brasiliensis]|uniref:hypothetical protein n=1 Tax=Nocardia brasiliensis TaxID=37326 RepID=UPI00245726F4|nr:hypothetical protein [Nocardia brasiliensis]
MRIIRNSDHNDEDPEDSDGNDPAVQGEILADEVADFLAAAAAAAPFYTGQDAPIEPAPIKPVLRLVKPDHTSTIEIPVTTAAGSKAWRAGAGGSTTVVVLALVAAWGEPAVVTVPLVVYGAGWIAYLWWNTALRPPIPQAAIAAWTAISHIAAAVARALIHTVRAVVSRIDIARTRHETARTATT